MSATTRNLRGTPGERRKMRQELERMVHQLEAESADRGENAGEGRIPAAFCTLTSAVYKWEQLHTILRRCSAVGEDQPFDSWKELDVGDPEERRL